MTMETSNDNNNPWSFQQHSHEEEDGQTDSPPHSLKLRLRRGSNDRRHLSFASTTTIAADASEEQYDKDLIFYVGHEYQPDSGLNEGDGRSIRQQSVYNKSWQHDRASGCHHQDIDARECPTRHRSALSSSSTSSSHGISFTEYQETSAEEASVLSSSIDPVTTRANGLQETTLADSGVGLEVCFFLISNLHSALHIHRHSADESPAI